ncbi:P-loop NTPase fold protein [Nostoc sp. ChiSLP03a]|uniref:P-loop NTPase fold protein n=1 Tax=Nostoc sp. ChiSLP03a TaxID=3075380 RepID=UPI002AD281D7|nr:P-loop NTPase fold protein [Nostoc sp. ChiSLP03a]MDZ8213266.1 AAA family ATPase [Nostoc sp. ChiSLP03a]
MSIDLREFYQASDPSRTLFVNNSSDGKYYIDFSSVRGGDILGKLKQKITFFKPNEPTCTLFTGHIGCGKSTELLRLQAELEKLGFHVVYFESSDDLEMTDVDIADVLLAIARRVSQSLDKITLESPNKFNELLQGAWKVLNSEVTAGKIKLPVVGDVGLSADKDKFSLSVGIGEITAKMKNDPMLREKLNQYLAPQKTKLLEAINQELLEPAIAKLKQQGKNGLVVIVDNLDRIDNRAKPWGRPQQEYLFVDQGEFLTKLNCHLIYTMPLSLKFSDDYGMLTQRFPEDPKVLPMVPIQWADGSVHTQGMSLMQQLVLARAFPDMKPEERLSKVTEIFDSVASLERLCQMSGGHVRDVLRLLNTWIMEEMSLPLTRETLEQVIRSRRNEIVLPISEDEWQLLCHVKEKKKVSDDHGYQKLIRSRFVFEYRDGGESWFDVNPVLAEARELQ